MATTSAIRGEKFFINGRPTYAGRDVDGCPVEGLLFNMRAVQATFDDENWPAIREYQVQDGMRSFAYPDTGRWDADRNVREFVEAMPRWREAGLLGLTVSLQGGRALRPIDKMYMNDRDHPYFCSAFASDGSLKPAYFQRLATVLDQADKLGMVILVSYFYFAQDGRLGDEAAVARGAEEATRWLLAGGWGNVIVELVNYCDHRNIDHAILRPDRVAELIGRVRGIEADGRRLPVTTAFSPLVPLPESVVNASDLVLLHGNGKTAEWITEKVREVRRSPAFQANPKPIVFNEAGAKMECLDAALRSAASWGYFEPGENNYRDGYQSPPVNWGLATPQFHAFLERLYAITGGL